MHTANVTGRKQRAREHEKSSEVFDDEGVSYKDKMVSLDM
jgi:hypothetical protein